MKNEGVRLPLTIQTTMKVKKLISLLEKIKDKDRELQILIGNEDEDFMHYNQFELMHTLDDDEGVVEIFANTENAIYYIN